MASLTTLTRVQTDFFFAARTNKNEQPPSGDFWRWLYSLPSISSDEYNTDVDNYLAWEELASEGLLSGTTPAGDTFIFVAYPDHPRPPRKPTE